MFGIDFSELVVIMVVALIVIGPEHLPKVARTAGHLWSRAQRYVNGIKSDIAREMEVEELRKIQKEAEQKANSIEPILDQAALDVQQKISAEVEQPTHVIIEEWERELQIEAEQKAAASGTTTAENKPGSNA
jgi:sec-independent protein translocase protein TatB